MSEPDDPERLWVATGPIDRLPESLRFGAFSIGLSATTPREHEPADQTVLVTYELSYGDQTEPWFVASDVVFANPARADDATGCLECQGDISDVTSRAATSEP